MVMSLAGILGANPHWYDYIHYLKFNIDGSLEMVDGGGQVINARVHGQFNISPLTDNQAEVSFTQLVEYNPYRKDEKIRDLSDFKTKLMKEEGIYAFYQEMFGKVNDPDDRICLLYRTRYVFEVDPLHCVAENQRGNLYHRTEKRDFVNSVRTYYSGDDVQRLTLKELRELGFDDKIQRDSNKNLLISILRSFFSWRTWRLGG